MSSWRSRKLPPFASDWGPRTWLLIAAYGIRAAFELALARISLRSVTGDTVMQLNTAAQQPAGGPAAAINPRIVVNVGWIVPRIAARLPWRADCLVQALAARRWLLSQGIGTEIVIGIDRSPAEGLLAHAWLRHGNQTVTGGDVSRYAVLVEAGNR